MDLGGGEDFKVGVMERVSFDLGREEKLSSRGGRGVVSSRIVMLGDVGDWRLETGRLGKHKVEAIVQGPKNYPTAVPSGRANG